MVNTAAGGGGTPTRSKGRGNKSHSSSPSVHFGVSPFEESSLNKFLHKVTNQSAPVGLGGYTPVDISGYVPNFTSTQRLALAHANLTPQQAASSPEILQILKEVQSQNADIQAAGGHVPDTSHRHGWLSRTLDVIQRPLYGVAEGARQVAEAVNSGDSNPIHDLEAFGHGAWQGLEGKKKTDFIQLLQEAKDIKAAKSLGYNGAKAIQYAKANPGSGGKLGIGGSLAGFGLDVVGDPLSYVGLGLVSKGAKAVSLSEDAVKGLETIKAAEKLSPASRDLITAAHYSAGKMSKAAAEGAVPGVHRIAENIAKVEGMAHYDKVIEDLVNKTTKAGNPFMTDREILAVAKNAKDTKEQEILKNILDNYNKVVEQHVGKQIAIKLPGMKVAIPGMPDVTLLSAATKGALSHIDPVAKGMRVFNKKFVAPSSHIPELHAQKLEYFGQGMTQAHFRGRLINHVLNPLRKDGRTEAWLAALHGHPSGSLVKLPDGSSMDAAEWMGQRLSAIKLSAHEMDLGPRDLQSWLPPGLEMKRSKVLINGKKVSDPNWITNSLKEWNMKDGGKGLWFIESAFEQARAYRSMLDSMAETFGTTLPKTATDAQKILHGQLVQKGWTKAERVPELDAHIFPPDVAKYVTQISEMLKSEKNWRPFWRTFGKIQRPIKFMLTLPNPSFHIHNAIGDAFINHLDETLPQHYAKSFQLLRHRSKWFEQEGIVDGERRFPLMSRAGDPLENARKVIGPDNLRFIKNKHGLKSADGKVHDFLSEAEVYAGYNKLGLRQNYASDLGFSDTSPVGALKGIIDRVTSASEAREDYFRVAHFINLIERNPSKARTLEEVMQFAGKRVRDTHFDYTDFTKFEKETMSQLIPFYKWTRKALPLMAQIFITDPGKVALIPKGLRAIASLTGNTDMLGNDTLPNLQGGIVPEWMMSAGYVPISNDFLGRGDPGFAYVANPFTDMISQNFNGLNDGSQGYSLERFLLGPASPLIKVPTELIQNKNSFTGAPVVRTDPGADSIPSQLLQYLATQAPMSNAGTQTGKGNIGTLLSLLTGISFQEDTSRRQKGELLRQRDVGRSILRKIRYENGGHMPGTLTGYTGRG